MHAIAAEVVSQPFEWGSTDCCTLALRIMTAITGVDHLARHAGGWCSARSALRWADAHGLPSRYLHQVASPIDLRYAQPGDILTEPGAHGMEGVYVVLGARLLTSAPETGVVLVASAGLVRAGRAAGWRL